MNEDHQPGYDYFVSSPQASAFRPVQPSGAADSGWALNSAQFRPAPQLWRLPGWANVVIATIAVLLLAGLGAAVAIPAVQRHGLTKQFEVTSIALPATFNGLRAARSGLVEQELASVSAGYAQTTTRIYGKDSLSLIMIMAFRPREALAQQDQVAARIELVKKLSEGTAGPRLRLTPASPGPLGGYFGCGKVAPATVCLGSDPGSVIAIVLGPAVSQPESVALTARQASVHRTA